MKLSARDAAKLLAQPEDTIYRWIKEGKLPAHKMNDSYWLNRAELLEWATQRGMQVSHTIFEQPEKRAEALPSVADALARGGVHHDVPGKTREATLRSVVELLPLPDGVDADSLVQMLLAREELGSTGLGDGIAFPHVRNPIVLHVDDPVVAVAYLEDAVEFDAIDGKPVSVLFTMVTPTVRSHLNMLSSLAHLLQTPEFRDAIRKKAPLATLVPLARTIEARLAEQRKGAARP